MRNFLDNLLRTTKDGTTRWIYNSETKTYKTEKQLDFHIITRWIYNSETKTYKTEKQLDFHIITRDHKSADTKVDVHLHCMENLMLEIISEGNISSKIPDHKDSKLVEYAIEIYDSITLNNIKEKILTGIK